VEESDETEEPEDGKVFAVTTASKGQCHFHVIRDDGDKVDEAAEAEEEASELLPGCGVCEAAQQKLHCEYAHYSALAAVPVEALVSVELGQGLDNDAQRRGYYQAGDEEGKVHGWPGAAWVIEEDLQVPAQTAVCFIAGKGRKGWLWGRRKVSAGEIGSRCSVFGPEPRLPRSPGSKVTSVDTRSVMAKETWRGSRVATAAGV
jgi:hypothetical protein